MGNDRFLALERGCTEGQGNSVHIYEISFAGLPDVSSAEGMALGPRLTQGAYDGRRPLYLVTDDNNSAEQTTRFYALAVTGL